MHMILGDEVSPGALLHFDAIALVPTTIVNVVQGDDAFTHDVFPMVGAEIHSLTMTGTVMDVIPRQIEALRSGTVRAEANLTGVMNVTLIQPDIGAVPEAHAMTAPCEFNPAQTEELDRTALANVEDIC